MYKGTDYVKQRNKQYNTHQHLVVQARQNFVHYGGAGPFSLLVMHSKRGNWGEEFGRDLKHNLRTFRGAFLGRRHYPIIGCLQLEIHLVQN